MDSACPFFKFGYCKLRDDCARVHFKEEFKDGLQCKVIKTCSLRHPKKCKRIVLEGICGYKERCAYNHKIGFHVNNVNGGAYQEDVNNLKTEVETLKNTIKSLVSIRQEFDKITNSVKYIKKEINKLKAKNKDVEKKI